MTQPQQYQYSSEADRAQILVQLIRREEKREFQHEMGIIIDEDRPSAKAALEEEKGRITAQLLRLHQEYQQLTGAVLESLPDSQKTTWLRETLIALELQSYQAIQEARLTGEPPVQAQRVLRRVKELGLRMKSRLEATPT